METAVESSWWGVTGDLVQGDDTGEAITQGGGTNTATGTGLPGLGPGEAWNAGTQSCYIKKTPTSTTGSPSASTTGSPSASTTASPSASTTGSPSASTTGSPSASTTGSPSASTTASPT